MNGAMDSFNPGDFGVLRTKSWFAQCRSLRRVLFLALMTATAGCGEVHFDVPEGTRVRLLEIDAPTSLHVERTVWYGLWGDQPLGDNHTASMIDYNKFKEVRMSNGYSTSDTIINTFTSIVTLSRRRIIIDGNTTETQP
jgi:hypothetical protein